VRASSIFFSALISLLAWFGADSAEAVSPAKHLGQAATVGKELGGCECTRVQFGDLGLSNASYSIPFDGVISKSGFLVGEEIQPTDWGQLRLIRPTGSTSGVVSAQGAQHFFTGLTPHTVQTFYERVPAQEGEVLGVRFHDSTFLGATPAWFETEATADEAGLALSSPEVGDSFTASVGQKRRVNLEAVLEPDADNDGYGDVSQDLCPGSPVGGTACTGSLFGSDFQGSHGGSGGSGFDSMYVQKAIGGVSTALPAGGVVVRWRVLGAPTGSYQLRVLAPSGSEYTVLRSSDVQAVSAEASPPIRPITSFATRLPIPAGSYLALATPTAVPESIPSPGSSLSKVNNAGDGATVPSLPTNIANSELAYDADVEPDVDGDGYGDVTQDACPTDASTQGPCTSPAAGPPSPSPSPPPSPSPTGPPSISGLKASPRRFRVDPRGAVVSTARAQAGTTFKLSLNEAAAVAFAVEARVACARSRAAARCKPWKLVHSFRRSLPAGGSSIRYSGRYAKGKVAARSLLPGPYRVTAVPTDAAGRRGAPARAPFTVLR
jgi:hypothetical protein